MQQSLPPEDVDAEKASEILGNLIEVFQQHKLTKKEIVIVLSNLTYSLGASIEGFGDTGPAIEDLEKLYYSEPGRLGVAMMLQATLMNQQWIENLEEKKGTE